MTCSATWPPVERGDVGGVDGVHDVARGEDARASRAQGGVDQGPAGARIEGETGEAEQFVLLALLLLTDARRPARTDPTRDPVLLPDQDRSRLDRNLIAEGEALLEQALHAGPAGVYVLQLAIAACHTTAPTAAETDWHEIAALYNEVLRRDANPVWETHRAVAVAYAEGPAAGLVVLDTVAQHPQLARWPGLHVARADLLRRLDRRADAVSAYLTVLACHPSPAERRLVQRRLRELE